MPIIKKNRAFVNLGLTANRFKRRGDSFIFVTAHVLETQNLYQDARVSCHVSSLAEQEKLNQVYFLTSSNTTIATQMKEPLAFSLFSQVCSLTSSKMIWKRISPDTQSYFCALPPAPPGVHSCTASATGGTRG